MKKLLIFTLLFIVLKENLDAQSLTDNKVVIVSCKDGDLYIDGALVGKIEAEDAKQQLLSNGEHYLQVKTATEKFNLTAKIDQNTRDIIRIGCGVATSAEPAPVEAPKAILLFEKQLNLGGTLTGEVQQNIVALDEGDNMLLTCAVLNKKGSANIAIREYFSGSEIFRKEGFNSIDQQSISVTTKGIYIISVTTGAIFGKDIKLSVARVPSPKSSPNFKTSVRKYYDTTQTEVLSNTVMVHSLGNMSGNRTFMKIPLPPNTTYWVYWIGVGQDARAKMKDFATKLANIAGSLSANPLVAYGMKLIPELPMLNGKSNISYRFMDTQNLNLFQSNHQFAPFNCNYADNITASYSLINGNYKDLNIGLVNSSSFIGTEVDVKVVAFSVKAKLAMED
ncbi:MAG: hypothetical protein QM726_10035 [Chitinophagaceae bacterium]